MKQQEYYEYHHAPIPTFIVLVYTCSPNQLSLFLSVCLSIFLSHTQTNTFPHSISRCLYPLCSGCLSRSLFFTLSISLTLSTSSVRESLSRSFSLSLSLLSLPLYLSLLPLSAFSPSGLISI